MDGIFLREQLKRFFPRKDVAAGTEEDKAGDGVAEEDAEEGERDVEPEDGGVMKEDDEEVAGDNGKVDETEEQARQMKQTKDMVVRKEVIKVGGSE